MGWGGGEVQNGGHICVYIYIYIADSWLLYSRNELNIVKQLYSNLNK